jgi:hypothetical protein
MKEINMIKLDLRTLLPQTRAAFEAGELQAQTGFRPEGATKQCLYAGPCAIGVAIPVDMRASFDGLPSTDIGYLIELGHVEVPEDQLEDFVTLQAEHDDWVGKYGSRESFEQTLIELEAKYVHQA